MTPGFIRSLTPLLLGCFACWQAAHGETVRFDFENLSPTNTLDRLVMTSGRLTVTVDHELENVLFAVSQRLDVERFNAVFGTKSLSAFNGNGGVVFAGAFVADFDPPLYAVSVDMGDFGEDADQLKLTAFAGPRGTGELLAETSDELPGGGTLFDHKTLSVVAPGGNSAMPIRSIVMIGGAVVFPNSVFYDNLLASPVLPADVNADRRVDVEDLNLVRNNFGEIAPRGGAVPGDTHPRDGVVNIDDLNRVRNDFGQVAGPPASVPEPTGIVLVLLGVMTMCMPRITRAARSGATPHRTACYRLRNPAGVFLWQPRVKPWVNNECEEPGKAPTGRS